MCAVTVLLTILTPNIIFKLIKLTYATSTDEGQMGYFPRVKVKDKAAAVDSSTRLVKMTKSRRWRSQYQKPKYQ